MKKIFVFALICLFLATTMVLAQEMPPAPGGDGAPPMMKQPPGGEKGKPGGPKGPDMMKMKIMESFFLDPMTSEYLGITDEQTAKLEKMKADHGKKMIDLKSEAGKLMIDMHSIMDSTNIDTSAARTILQKLAGIETAVKIEGLTAFNGARSVLTAEQKTKLEKLWKGKVKPDHGKKMMKDRPEGKCDESPDADCGMGLVPDEK
ncbi:MAG: periplasmic heavy metal sensor [Firmicutes bacterium]|nr:periplasmic heavy metal sensor [Bacillota bacterium]